MESNISPAIGVTSAVASEIVLAITGRLGAVNLSAVWEQAVAPVRSDMPSKLTVRHDGLTYCDGTGIGMLMEVDAIVRATGGDVTFSGASNDVNRMLDLAPQKDPEAVFNLWASREGIVVQVGRGTASLLGDVFDFLSVRNSFEGAQAYACDCDLSAGPGGLRNLRLSVLPERIGEWMPVRTSTESKFTLAGSGSRKRTLPNRRIIEDGGCTC